MPHWPVVLRLYLICHGTHRPRVESSSKTAAVQPLIPLSHGCMLLRSLTSATLPINCLRCNIAAPAFGDSLLRNCLLRPLHRLSAMSTAAQSAAPANRNKRAADKQQGGKWKRRHVWKGREEGSRLREDRERKEGEQQTSTETGSDASGVPTAAAGEASEKRLPKRKVAVVFGYNGGGYAGLQIQTGSDKRTIEADVADAILKAGGMLATNREQLSKLSWQRCARTDKGVHAVTNVLSLNLITQPDGLLEVIPKSNQRMWPSARRYLPTDVPSLLCCALCVRCRAISASTLICPLPSAALPGCV